LYDSGEIAEEVGEMLEQERGIEFPEWGPDEDYVFSMIERLTGIDIAMLESVSFMRFALM
jgi:hypothetical protein